MREFRTCVIAFAAAAACLGTVWAADKPAEPARHGLVPEEGAVELMLLWQKSVREDMKLSDDESMKVREFVMQQWKKAKELENAGEADQDKGFTELTKENEKFLKETLSPEQTKRLEQIALQKAGLLWVTRKHIASELNLTDEQMQKAHELQEQARKQVQEYLSSDREAKKGEVEKLHEESRNGLKSLLTDEQKAKWKEMRGEPFKGEFEFGQSKQ